MPLSHSEQGTLNGMFEVHFKTQKPVGKNISKELCRQWEEVFSKNSTATILEKFEEHFETTLPQTYSKGDLEVLWRGWKKKLNKFYSHSNRNHGH